MPLPAPQLRQGLCSLKKILIELTYNKISISKYITENTYNVHIRRVRAGSGACARCVDSLHIHFRMSQSGPRSISETAPIRDVSSSLRYKHWIICSRLMNICDAFCLVLSSKLNYTAMTSSTIIERPKYYIKYSRLT